MSVKIVPTAHYVPPVQKRQKEKTENYSIMKNGNTKNNMLEKSFQMKKQVRSMGNVR